MVLTDVSTSLSGSFYLTLNSQSKSTQTFPLGTRLIVKVNVSIIMRRFLHRYFDHLPFVTNNSDASCCTITRYTNEVSSTNVTGKDTPSNHPPDQGTTSEKEAFSRFLFSPPSKFHLNCNMVNFDVKADDPGQKRTASPRPIVTAK